MNRLLPGLNKLWWHAPQFCASLHPYGTHCNDAWAWAEEMAVDVVVIGGSAGGMPALRMLINGLPADLPVPVIAMLHLPPVAEAECVL